VVDGSPARFVRFRCRCRVEGHTDSDGDVARITQLSIQRAEAVRLALVARGLPEATIIAEGFGSQQPVLVGGVEDKAASRRVEFRVTAA
jgi:outer membrane protein OmpA-like peptidoglycan-associated protein